MSTAAKRACLLRLADENNQTQTQRSGSQLSLHVIITPRPCLKAGIISLYRGRLLTQELKRLRHAPRGDVQTPHHHAVAKPQHSSLTCMAKQPFLQVGVCLRRGCSLTPPPRRRSPRGPLRLAMPPCSRGDVMQPISRATTQTCACMAHSVPAGGRMYEAQLRPPRRRAAACRGGRCALQCRPAVAATSGPQPAARPAQPTAAARRCCWQALFGACDAAMSDSR
jgi:hypothetical protein